jgi:hypothetical protein
MSKGSKDNLINVMDLIPNNANDVADIQKELSFITNSIRKDDYNNNLNEEKKKYYYNKLINISDKIADCSRPAFNIRDMLEESYTTRYKDNPKEGYKQFLNHYGSIHKPYDTVKNNIWKSLKLITNEE